MRLGNQIPRIEVSARSRVETVFVSELVEARFAMLRKSLSADAREETGGHVVTVIKSLGTRQAVEGSLSARGRKLLMFVIPAELPAARSQCCRRRRKGFISPLLIVTCQFNRRCLVHSETFSSFSLLQAEYDPDEQAHCMPS